MKKKKPIIAVIGRSQERFKNWIAENGKPEFEYMLVDDEAKLKGVSLHSYRFGFDVQEVHYKVIREAKIRSRLRKSEALLDQIQTIFGIGCRLICEERLKQMCEYGFTAHHHKQNPDIYDDLQLQQASVVMLRQDLKDGVDAAKNVPHAWNKSWLVSMSKSPRLKRVKKAAAMLAAELDRTHPNFKTT